MSTICPPYSNDFPVMVSQHAFFRTEGGFRALAAAGRRPGGRIRGRLPGEPKPENDKTYGHRGSTSNNGIIKGIYIYIYIHKYIHIYIYIYVYIYMYICTWISNKYLKKQISKWINK